MSAEVSLPALRMLNPVSLASDSADTIHDDVPTAQLHFRSLQEKDAFLLFRALCRLSTKSLPDKPDPK